MKHGGAGLFFYPLLFLSLLLVQPAPPRADDLFDALKSLERLLKKPDRKKRKEAAPVLVDVAGVWRINAAGYAGQLVMENTGGGLVGRVWFDAHQVWEELRDVRLEGATLSFLRPGPNQHYTGILSGNEARGTFDGSAPWSMTRAAPAQPGMAEVGRRPVRESDPGASPPPRQTAPAPEESPATPPIVLPVADLEPGKALAADAVPLRLEAGELFQSIAGVGDMADAALMAEGMKLLLGETQSTVTVARRAAPYYLYPSPAVRDQLAKLRPVWVESVGLKGAIAASASAFDAAWEEVTVAAALESEQGTRAALALAAQHKAELDALQARLVEVASLAKKAGEPRNPIDEYKQLLATYRLHLKATGIAAGVNLESAAANRGWGYKLIKQESLHATPYRQDGEEAVWSLFEPADIWNRTDRRTTIRWRVPQVIWPDALTEFHIQGSISGDTGVRASIRTTLGREPVAQTSTIIAGLRMTNGDTSLSGPNVREDRFSIAFPDVNRLAAELKQRGQTRHALNVRNQGLIYGQVVSHNGVEYNPGVPSALAIEPMESSYSLARSDSDRSLPRYISVEVMLDNETAKLARYTYLWSDDCSALPAPVAEPRDDPTDAEKRQRIAEIDANVAIIRHNVRRDREDLARESNPGRRALLEFRILHGESDALAEQDLKQSLLTGQHVHTRSPFDEHVRGQFIENIRRDQMRMEEFQRGSASLQRLAALLPADDADQARAFIARQVGAADIARLDVAKLRRVADILFNQVQAKAQLDAARGEEEAAQVGLDMAMRAKAAADGGMMMTSLVAGPWLNVAYQGATGAWDGGFVEGINRAASTYSMPTFLAAQAYQGYQAGGWRGAAENVAISYVTGKAIQYGLTKSITAASRLFKPTSQEAFDLARHRQARERGESLVKDFQRTETEVIRLRAALSRGESGAEAKLRQLLQTREAKAAVIHENMHAKSFLKYKGDYHTQKVFNDDLGQIHERVQQRFHENMQGKGWMRTPLKEFRNASSAGTVGLDYDIGMDEKAVGALMKFGKPATLHDWQKDAQVVWNQSYKTVTGRGAQRSWETVTTSIHPEAYKDVALLSGNPAAVSKLWAQQSADVTRYKNWHMMNDPGMQIYEKLQEISRGSAKDMATKMLPLLGKAANAGGPGAQAMRQTNQHWRKVYGILDKFGKGDMDPVTASRQIRELTGGKSIAEVTEDMAALFEGLAKRSGSATH